MQSYSQLSQVISQERGKNGLFNLSSVAFVLILHLAVITILCILDIKISVSILTQFYIYIIHMCFTCMVPSA